MDSRYLGFNPLIHPLVITPYLSLPFDTQLSRTEGLSRENARLPSLQIRNPNFEMGTNKTRVWNVCEDLDLKINFSWWDPLIELRLCLAGTGMAISGKAIHYFWEWEEWGVLLVASSYPQQIDNSWMTNIMRTGSYSNISLIFQTHFEQWYIQQAGEMSTE